MDPAATPEPPPLARPPPVMDEIRPGRKILWSVLVTLALAPPVWLAVALLFLAAAELGRARWLEEHENLMLFLAGGAAAAIIAGFLRRGLKRGAPGRPRQIPGWSLAAIGVLAGTVLLTTAVVRTSRVSRTKAVLGNLRWLSAGSDQFFVENPSRVFHGRDDLIGPTRYIKALTPVDGENYDQLFPLRTGWPEPLVVTMPWGEKVTFDPVDARPPPPRDGVQVERRPDGSRFETTWREGMREGPFHAYHADGSLWDEATYSHGRVTGPVWNYSEAPRFDELDPEQLPANAARRKLATGDFRGALGDFNRAARLSPDDLELLLGRADACVGLGDFDQAVADLQRVQTKDQEHGLTNEARQLAVRIDVLARRRAGPRKSAGQAPAVPSPSRP